MGGYGQGNAFRILTAPAAWDDLGRVGREVHRRIVTALQGIAAEAPLATDAPEDSQEPLHVIVDGYRIDYEISHEAGFVRLVSVRPEAGSR